MKDYRYTLPNGKNNITAGQAGLACINANRISDRQQEPAGNREGALPVASKEAMESPSFTEGEDVNNLHLQIYLIPSKIY